MAIAKCLSTFWLTNTGLALLTTLSAVIVRKQHKAMFYGHQRTRGRCLMSPLFDTESCKEKNKTEQHLLTRMSFVARGTVIHQLKWESWFIMFSSSSKLFLASATVCCHLSSADKTLYWVIIYTGSLKATCFAGRMGAAHNHRVSRYRR